MLWQQCNSGSCSLQWAEQQLGIMLHLHAVPLDTHVLCTFWVLLDLVTDVFSPDLLSSCHLGAYMFSATAFWVNGYFTVMKTSSANPRSIAARLSLNKEALSSLISAMCAACEVGRGYVKLLVEWLFNYCSAGAALRLGSLYVHACA